MFIQFAGYAAGANSRIYNFNVVDPRGESRQFTVEIEAKAVGVGALQLQDGPSICFNRLRRELESETPELCAKPHLCVGERDVQEYLALQPKESPSGQDLRPIP